MAIYERARVFGGAGVLRGVSAVLLRIAKCDGLLICCRGFSGEITGSAVGNYVCGIAELRIVCEGGIARGRRSCEGWRRERFVGRNSGRKVKELS